ESPERSSAATTEDRIAGSCRTSSLRRPREVPCARRPEECESVSTEYALCRRLLRLRGRCRAELLGVLCPFDDLDEDRPQAAGVGGDLVLHPGRHLGEDRALDQAVLFQGAQLGGQHVLGDARQAALEFAKAVGAL